MRAEDREALVRRSMEAWNAEDWERELKAIWSPGGAIVSPEGWPESGEFHGWPAMVEQWRRIKGSWAEERVELVEAESVGERVLGSIHWVMQGETSGAAIEVDVAIVCEFQDDRLSRMEYFLDREAARAAMEAAE